MHALCFVSFLHLWFYRFSPVPEFYKLVMLSWFVEKQKQNQDNTGRFRMKSLPKRLGFFLPKRLCRNVLFPT